jgi:hypothetical protein
MTANTGDTLTTPTPSVGRIVHYVSYGTPGGEYASQCRAAIVTDLYGKTDDVGLAVLNPTGMFFNGPVQHDGGEESWLADGAPLCGDKVYPGGTWHWPAQV